MRTVARLAACCLLGAALLVAGCAEEQGKPKAEKQSQQAPVPAPIPPDYGAEAEATLRSFYGVLNYYDYRAAWQLLGRAPRAEFGGFVAWSDGYATNMWSKLRGLTIVTASADEVSFSGTLESNDFDVCGNDVYQDFSGTWVLQPSTYGDWTITDVDLAKTSGGTPVLDPAECGYAPGPDTEYVPEPSDSYEYDRPYPDRDCGDPGVGTDIPVGPDDPDGFDADGDGIGCES